MKVLEKNLKSNCCVKTLSAVPAAYQSIKLYDTIKDACLQNLNFKWYNLNKILKLNSNTDRPTGIVCHECSNGNCVLSIKINKRHTRFCEVNSITYK